MAYTETDTCSFLYDGYKHSTTVFKHDPCI